MSVPALAPIIDELVVDRNDFSDPCASAEFGPVKFRVTIPLAGSGVVPDAVYARTIFVGWVGKPALLRNFRVRLQSMRMINDMDGGRNDCECTFFWMNLNRARIQIRHRMMSGSGLPISPGEI